MFKEKYAEAIRNTELKLAEEKGEKRGEQIGENKLKCLMTVLKKNNNQLWMHLDELSTEELDVLYKESNVKSAEMKN